jgi:glutamine amidotransferase-like uncharacterized protein
MSFSAVNDKIVVLNGPSYCIGSDCYEATINSMCELGIDPARIIETDFSYMERGLPDDMQVFVVPGGNAFHIGCTLASKHEDSLKKVREFVDDGGGYLGFCAGAIIAGVEPGFRIPGPKPGEVALPHAFGLTGSPMTTPAFSDAVYPCGEDTGRAAKIDSPVGNFYSYWNWGPSFSSGSGDSVVATFSEIDGNPPAIVETVSGLGRVTLLSPHLEFSAEDYASWSGGLTPGDLEKLTGEENESCRVDILRQIYLSSGILLTEESL